MASDFSIAFSHVGIFVNDIERMIDFYTRFMRFVLTDRAAADTPTRKGGAQASLCGLPLIPRSS